jgi:hypothetical protein
MKSLNSPTPGTRVHTQGLAATMNSRDPLMNSHDKCNVHQQKSNSNLIPSFIADISLQAMYGSKIFVSRSKNCLTLEMLAVYKVIDAI